MFFQKNSALGSQICILIVVAVCLVKFFIKGKLYSLLANKHLKTVCRLTLTLTNFRTRLFLLLVCKIWNKCTCPSKLKATFVVHYILWSFCHSYLISCTSTLLRFYQFFRHETRSYKFFTFVVQSKTKAYFFVLHFFLFVCQELK